MCEGLFLVPSSVATCCKRAMHRWPVVAALSVALRFNSMKNHRRAPADSAFGTIGRQVSKAFSKVLSKVGDGVSMAFFRPLHTSHSQQMQITLNFISRFLYISSLSTYSLQMMHSLANLCATLLLARRRQLSTKGTIQRSISCTSST